jgi:hypothetical protein
MQCGSGESVGYHVNNACESSYNATGVLCCKAETTAPSSQQPSKSPSTSTPTSSPQIGSGYISTTVDGAGCPNPGIIPESARIGDGCYEVSNRIAATGKVYNWVEVDCDAGLIHLMNGTSCTGPSVQIFPPESICLSDPTDSRTRFTYFCAETSMPTRQPSGSPTRLPTPMPSTRSPTKFPMSGR